MATKQFFGGIPYAPDIKKLRLSYPDNELKIGKIIPYHEISEIIHENKKTSRFYAVTSAWRRQVEKESGIFIQPVGDGQRFKIISESEKLELANREDRTATKKSRRSLIVLKSINDKELSADEKPLFNFKLEKLGRVLAIQQIRTPQALPEI
jgi:hypothetical protein